MDRVVKHKMAAVFAGGLLAAVLSGAPAQAEEDTLFGQPAPKQFLLNKMLNPQSSQPAAGVGQPAGTGSQTAGAKGQAVGQAAEVGGGQSAAGEAAEADEDGPGPYPKRYLLNKLFDGNK